MYVVGSESLNDNECASTAKAFVALSRIQHRRRAAIVAMMDAMMMMMRGVGEKVLHSSYFMCFYLLERCL